jgi:soluble P-type ATPase
LKNNWKIKITYHFRFFLKFTRKLSVSWENIMPIQLTIKGTGEIILKNLILDLNGTISEYGELIEDCIPLIVKLKDQLNIYLVTGDTFGTGEKIAERLGIHIHKLDSSESDSIQKANFVKLLGSDITVALGNGRNDRLMMEEARIGIAIIGKEGGFSQTIASSDITCYSPLDALHLLMNPTALIATLRD